MSSSPEVVDPTGDSSRRLKRFLWQIGVPILGVTLVIVAILGIGRHSYHSNRRNIMDLSRHLIRVQRAYISSRVSSYLSPAIGISALSRDILEHVSKSPEEKIFQGLCASSLRQAPQVESCYLADENGRFFLTERHRANQEQDGVKHADKEDGYEVTRVEGKDGAWRFVHEFYESSGRFISRTHTDRKGAMYDPRERFWYKEAVKRGGKIYWSTPHRVGHSQVMGITVSSVFTGQDGRRRVLAVNIGLDRLSGFLSGLRIGQHGEAVILSQDGEFVAFAAKGSFSNGAAEAHAKDQKARIDPDRMPVLAKAFDRYRVHGYGSHSIRVGQHDYMLMAAQLPTSTQGWVLLIIVPESDFYNHMIKDVKNGFLLSQIIVLLVIGLAVLLIRQERKTERLARRLEDQQAVTVHEGQILRKMALMPGLFDHQNEALVLSESLAQIAQARRVSFWRLKSDGESMICEDAYDQDRKGHTGGFEILRSDMPDFFAVVAGVEDFEQVDAASDPRVQALYRQFMRPFGSKTLSVLPVMAAQGVLGAVFLEDARRIGVTQHFVQIVAAIVGVRFNAQTRAQRLTDAEAQSSLLPADEDGAIPPGPDDGGRNFLVAPGVFSGGDMQALMEGEHHALFPSVALMVITFENPHLHDIAEVEADVSIVESLSGALQDIARQNSLYSIKVVGNRLLVVANCSKEPDPSALSRLAVAAVQIREAFLTALAQVNIDPVFKIGLHIGPALGAFLGHGDMRTFNIWGYTVHITESMAQSVPDSGMIQVSEPVFLQLRDQFQFRLRGRFYFPHLGVIRTFYLTGRR